MEGETVWSGLYPGNVHTVHCLQPAVLAVETALELAPEQRKRTAWRLDGGSGSDDQLIWLLSRGYHVSAKGMSNRRAEALSRQVLRWDAYGANAWLGEVESPIDYGRPARVFVKRRLKDGLFFHSYYVSTLSLPSKGGFQRLYDAQAGLKSNNFARINPGWVWKPVANAVLPGNRATSCSPTWLITCWPILLTTAWQIRQWQDLDPNALCVICSTFQALLPGIKMGYKSTC